MRNFSLLFLVLCFFTHASANSPIAPYLTSENDTLSLVDETVDAYNGKFVQMDTDIQIQGSHPLEINRYYDGGHHFDGDVGYGVGLSFPIFLKFNEFQDKKNLVVEQRVGFEVVCTVTADKKNKTYHGKVDPDFFKHGYTNCAEALLKGEPSLLAMKIEGNKDQFIVTLGDGTKRYYSLFLHSPPELLYRLEREDYPDGCHRHYKYNDSQSLMLKQVWTTNPDNTLAFNAVNFSHHGDHFRIDASNGQQVYYHLKVKKGEAKNHTLTSYQSVKFSKEILQKVEAKHLPTCEYEALSRSHYKCSLFSTEKVKLPDGRFIKASYDDHERVKKLWASDLNVPLYEFGYHNNHTSVTDANGGIQRFFYNNRHLVRHEEPHCTQQFTWDEKGQLTKQVLTDTSNAHLIERDYNYDARGNIVEAKVTGNILIKGSKEPYSIRYHYSDDEKNLLVCEEHPDGYMIGYGYVPNTNLMNLKRVVSNGQIVEREFYHYDTNGIRTVTVIDDGSGLTFDDFSNVTYRKIIHIVPQLDPTLQGITLPSVIQESYQDPLTGAIHPLKRIEKTYCKGDLLAEEKVFDAEGKYCYSTRYEYNDRRQLISETDPLGHQTVYQYDSNGNKTYEEKIGSGRKILYTYDKSNHLISELEDADGKTFTTSHNYDAVGNRTETTDLFGQKSNFTYDHSGREISSKDPLGNLVIKTYDAQGNITSQIDQDGHLTKTLYNLYNKPLEIHHPDGTDQRFIYNLYGHQVYEKERDGLETFYEVDYKGRVKSAKTYSNGTLLKTIQKIYKGPNLIHEIDAMGNQTSYTYDPAGRLITTQQGEKTTQLTYDSLGRIAKTITPERTEVKEYDVIDRVIEERIEDSFGIVFQKTCYTYDINSNCISQKHYNNADTFAETKTSFNSRSLPISTTDACGNTTTIVYHYFDHLRKEIIDPLGRRKLEIYDPLEQLNEVFISSSNGTLLAHCNMSYDGRGNQICRLDDVICDGKVLGKFAINTAYDCMSQKTLEIEQQKKATAYTYQFERLHTITKPDGVILNHSYDTLGRLAKLTSSDGTIDYLYTYDLNDNLIKVDDRIHVTITTRSYDSYNRLVYEKQATGFEITYAYDTLDRLKEVSFQNNNICYEYDPLSLTSVKRYLNNNLLYQYNQKTDWNGNIQHSELPQTSLAYSWDPMGRCLEIDSPFYQQNATYNAVGNLTNLSVTDPLGSYDTIYTYDDLDQLTSESGPFDNQYVHDSLNNRRSKNQSDNTINDLNQVLQDKNNQYTYDPNGRRLTKQNASYTYDALGRLTFITAKENIFYHYDPFGRLIERCTDKSKEKFLYQFDTEIASFENDQMTALKTLYGTHSPFALELKGKVYSPVRNHRGDICLLLTDTPACTNRYNAFGDFSEKGTISSPWLFSGQRYDIDSGLYHYAKREYDPSLGIWLTPDPAGYVDGPNLYAYVKNNPLTYIDPYGLWMEEVNRAHRIMNGLNDAGNYIHEKYRDVRDRCRAVRDFSHGFGRGFLDDTTFGASEHYLGEYKFKTQQHKLGYHSGRFLSFGTSFLYGGGELKVGMAALKGAAGAGRASFTAAKSLLQGKAAFHASSKVKSIFQRSLNGIHKTANDLKRSAKKIASETAQKTSRNANHLTPHPTAIGSHSSFRRHSLETTHYQTYRPQTNPKDPKPWESVVRFDGKSSNTEGHFNKSLQKYIAEPHVHDPKYPGGVRPAEHHEIPTSLRF